MSITAAATSAPATTWWARLPETPGSSAISSRSISSSLGIHSARSAAGRIRRTSGPSLEAAAPQMRASERNVFEVATAWSGAPPRRSVPASWAMSVRICLRSLCSALSLGGPSRKCSLLERPAPSGSDQATSGASSSPPATSREPPPMSKTASRPEDQPNQRRTARKVSRASSSPGSTLISTPVRLCTWASTSSQLPASRTAEVAKEKISSQPLSSASSRACPTNSVSAATPSSLTVPSFSRCSARRSGSL